jgi:hypothetical protein
VDDYRNALRMIAWAAVVILLALSVILPDKSTVVLR